MDKEKIKIALYDIDYTIISCNSLKLFTFYLIKKKPIRIFLLIFLSFLIVLWFLRFISTKTIKTIYLHLLKGYNTEEISNLSKEFVNNILLKYIKPQAVESINNYKKKGYKIIFATASFEIYMKYLAEYFNADYIFGTKIAFNNTKMTLEIEGKNCRDNEKIERILSIIPENQIDKSNSVSFSDNLSDLPFLKLTATFHLLSMKKWKFLKIIKS